MGATGERRAMTASRRPAPPKTVHGLRNGEEYRILRNVVALPVRRGPPADHSPSPEPGASVPGSHAGFCALPKIRTTLLPFCPC